jgi:hypothetical protein
MSVSPPCRVSGLHNSVPEELQLAGAFSRLCVLPYIPDAYELYRRILRMTAERVKERIAVASFIHVARSSQHHSFIWTGGTDQHPVGWKPLWSRSSRCRLADSKQRSKLQRDADSESTLTMSNSLLDNDGRSLRDTDSNSLLRMYDSAAEVLNKTNLQLERTRADKLIQRITKELQKRNVKF